MAIYTGVNGKIIFDGDSQVRVKSWTLDASLAMLDTTELGKDSVQNEAGLKSFSGTANIMYHNDNNRLARMLDNIFTKSVPVPSQVEFQWGDKTIKFNAFVTSASLSMATGEIMTADVTFTAAGDLLGTPTL